MIREMSLLLGEGVGAREELRPPDKPSAGGNAEDDRRMLRQVGDMGGVRGDTRCPGQHQARAFLCNSIGAVAATTNHVRGVDRPYCRGVVLEIKKSR
jgi:hypothetical protein